ncbi:ribonuclease H-like domain-containing protein [Tanacetum coccineum]
MLDDSPVMIEFKTGDGFHGPFPLPTTGNYMPSKDLTLLCWVDDSFYNTKRVKLKLVYLQTIKDIVKRLKLLGLVLLSLKIGTLLVIRIECLRPNLIRQNQSFTGQRKLDHYGNNAQPGEPQNKLTHPHPKRKFVPTAILIKSGQVPVNAVKQSSPRAATSISTVRPGNPQYILQDQEIFDSGCSRHMTEKKCLELSPDFKLLDESQVLLKVPRQNNMYSFDLKNVVPSGEGYNVDGVIMSRRWLGAGRGRGVGKCVIITGLEEGMHGGTEGGRKWLGVAGMFYGMKGIKREFSVARTPKQNGVAERKNRTLIEAARTMLVDSLLPTTFWAEEISTACYVHNRVLVTKHTHPLGNFDGKADEGILGWILYK